MKRSMDFALKGLMPSIVHDALHRGGGLCMLQSLRFSSLPLSKSSPRISRLQISARPINHIVAACSNGQGLDDNCAPSGSSPSSMEASLDIKLPRRNLIVQFTCNSCGERTQRRISRVAYERGTVFVQCAGCLVKHKLVDNLGLVVEYDLRECLDVDPNGTH